MSDSQDATVGERLNARGWMQGSIAGADATRIVADALIRQDCGDLADLLVAGKFCAVVITQTCDLVHPDEAVEPYVEFAIAQLTDGKAPHQDTVMKSFRRFAAPLSDGKRHLQFRPWNRCHVQRGALTETDPSTELMLGRRARQDLVHWLTTRYKRAAFPNCFNDRLAAVKAPDRLCEALDAAPDLTDVFLLLRPRDEELKDEAIPYTCDIVLLCKRDVSMDTAGRLSLEPTVQAVEEILAEVPGIAVENVVLRGEEQFSLHEMREYEQWQFDHVSFSSARRAEKKGGTSSHEFPYDFIQDEPGSEGLSL